MKRSSIILLLVVLLAILLMVEASPRADRKKTRKPRKSRSKKTKTKTTKTKTKTKTKTTKTTTKTTTGTTEPTEDPKPPKDGNLGTPNWSFMNWNKASGDLLEGWGVVKDAYGEDNREIVADPAGGSDKVLRIAYPAGTYAPSGGKVGGTGFYANPVDIPEDQQAVTYEYSIFFPSGFDFVKGGKMPGLYGGHSSCSGGNPATDCFSTRLMWRTGGMGELYAYIPKTPQNLCKRIDVCNPEYGNSLGRGNFTFDTGKWTVVRQTIIPNKELGALTGVARIYINGKLLIDFKTLDFRTKPIYVMGMDFETFFGGGDSSWASPKLQYTYFKGIKLWYHKS